MDVWHISTPSPRGVGAFFRHPSPGSISRSVQPAPGDLPGGAIHTRFLQPLQPPKAVCPSRTRVLRNVFLCKSTNITPKRAKNRRLNATKYLFCCVGLLGGLASPGITAAEGDLDLHRPSLGLLIRPFDPIAVILLKRKYRP